MSAWRPILACLFGLLASVGNVASRDRPPAPAPAQAAAAPAAKDPLDGWQARPSETVSVDAAVPFDGEASFRIQRDERSQGDFSVVMREIPIDFTGSKIELRGHLRTQDVSQFSGLWMREDGVDPGLEFDNMQSRRLAGSTDWAAYSIALPINPAATALSYGVLLGGTGVVWSDRPQLFVDGKPIAVVARIERKKTVYDTDREFDQGSRVRIDALSDRQLDDLVLLGEVWGFLKYFHPALTAGTRQWDYELFRWLPRILAAKTPEEARRLLADWIDTLGPLAPCSPCVPEPAAANVQLPSPTGWIRDEARLGSRLSRQLVEVYRNRRPGTQFYVSLVPGVGNPNFQNEPLYAQVASPDSGFQILAAYRFWAIVQYWFPYRDLIPGNWTQALRESLAAVAQAREGKEFDRAMLKLTARVADTHVNLWGSLAARPPEGECQLPVAMRFIDGRAVVSRIADGQQPAVRRGDVLTRLDGEPIGALVARWLPYYAGSNEAARMRDIANSMTRGACGDLPLDIERDGKAMPVVARRVPAQQVRLDLFHDLPGETFRRLSPEVAYLKLSSIKSADVAGYVEAAKGTKGLIVDLRNYPGEFVVFSLGSAFVDAETPFALFTVPGLSDPGAFVWGNTVRLTPSALHYAGKIVILVDEVTQSQAEYTAMALRASPRATILGSTTAGADGNASRIPLPGGRRSMISGIGVFHPDKRPTQQVGIVPDIVVKPTLRGIREGRDELVERAEREILGPASSRGATR